MWVSAVSPGLRPIAGSFLWGLPRMKCPRERGQLQAAPLCRFRPGLRLAPNVPGACNYREHRGRVTSLW